MIRKIKGLGIALVAVMALGVVSVSAAEASSEIHITTGARSVFFGAQHTQNHKFQLTASNNSATCTEAVFEGEHAGTVGAQQSTTQDVTATATYTGCTCFGVTCQIKMNGCKYTLTGEGQAALTFKVDVAFCTQTDGKAYGKAGGTGVTKAIELVTLIGTATVAEQATIGGHITFANVGSGQQQELTGQVTVQGIKYVCDGTVPSCTAGPQTLDGDYIGQVTFRGGLFTSEEQKTHNGHQYQKLKQNGTQKGLFAT